MENSVVSNNMAKRAVPEDGKVYFLTNKFHYQSRLGLFGHELRPCEDVGSNQLWVLREDQGQKGWFYIENATYTGKRIVKAAHNGDVTTFDGKHYPDQLWKFVPSGEGCYYIYNKYFPEYRLGTTQDAVFTFGKDKYDDQLWFFTPRFEAVINDDTLWETDNRQGSRDFSERVKVTTGLKLTTSESFTTTIALTTSLEAALDGICGASMELKTELSNTLETGSEKSWVTEREITFTAPAGKNYRIRTSQASFTSLLHDDDCVFSGGYTVEESTEDFED